jgi:hypothetical protein
MDVTAEEGRGRRGEGGDMCWRSFLVSDGHLPRIMYAVVPMNVLNDHVFLCVRGWLLIQVRHE